MPGCSSFVPGFVPGHLFFARINLLFVPGFVPGHLFFARIVPGSFTVCARLCAGSFVLCARIVPGSFTLCAGLVHAPPLFTRPLPFPSQVHCITAAHVLVTLRRSMSTAAQTRYA